MNLIFASLLFSITAPTPPALPPIQRVLVLGDRAEVTRGAAAHCSGERAELEFNGLPLSIDPRTLRGQASGKAEVIGVTHAELPQAEPNDERVRSRTKEVEQLDRQLQALDDQSNTATERERNAGAYGQYFQPLLAEGMRSPTPEIDAWRRALDQLRDEHQKSGKARLEREIQMRKLREKREVLVREIARFRPNAPGIRTARVIVDCHGESSTEVKLSYTVPSVIWHPEYDLRFSPDGDQKVGPGKFELALSAVVQQSTGEDWNDVTLTLSTAKPKLGAEAPIPAPITVSGSKGEKTKVLVEAQEHRESLSGPAGESAEGPSGAKLEDRGQSFVLELPHRVTVIADGRPTWMPVDVRTARAESKLVAIPKLRPYVFQMVSLTNPAPYPLLEGRIAVSRRGSFVGRSSIPYRAPGEPMEISLGIDEELKVERKSLIDLDRQPGLLSSTKHLERAWRIALSNRTKTAVTVEVRENIPVSKQEAIGVELDNSKSSPGYQLDRERGIVHWSVKLPKGGETAVDLRYTIHLPDDWQVR